MKVIQRWPEKFSLIAFSYYKNFKRAREIQEKFQIKYVCCNYPKIPQVEKDYWNHKKVNFFCSLEEILSVEYDKIITAIVGSVGVKATLKAAQQGKTILIANKESLVMAGEFVMKEARKHRSLILPIDSEHNSIFRLLQEVANKSISKIFLTASGGPLQNLTKEEIKQVKKEEVLKHPNWNMGNKITVDSASLINKSLEIMEAYHIFNRKLEDIDAVIHPQSYIHAILKHQDGSFYFHASQPDMLYSISYCFFYPGSPPYWIDNYTDIFPDLTFKEIDHEKFPGFSLGIQSAQRGGAYPAIFNASNEQAVSAFLKGQIKFHEIPQLIEHVLNQKHDFENTQSIEDIFEADSWARMKSTETMMNDC